MMKSRGKPWNLFGRALCAAMLLVPLRVPAQDFATEIESRYVLPLLRDTPGGALVVVERGKVVLERVYGVRDLEDREPVTRDTLFRIASLSKTFASAAASMLVSESDLSWHTPLRSNLSHLRFKEPVYGDRITLFHLMSQSTGLMPHAYTNLIEENMSYRRIVDRLDRVDFVCPPGDCYGYQNVAFSLVADLVQSEIKTDYVSYVDARIFKPLGMKRASFGHAAFIKDSDHARPHVWNGKRWRDVRPTAHYYKVPPAAGVNASISDLKLWLIAQLGYRPEVLPAEMLDEMHKRVIRTSRHQAHYPYRKALGQVHYGLGWRVFSYGGLDGFVHHGGYVKGMCSAMVFNRQTRSGMVLLTNSEPRGINDLVLSFAEIHNRHFGVDSQLARR